MSYGVTHIKEQICFYLKISLKKHISFNLKWYNFQQFCTNDSKVCLVVKVCLEIVQQVIGENIVNYNLILNKWHYMKISV